MVLFCRDTNNKFLIRYVAAKDYAMTAKSIPEI
jgi:hypothetical protein